MIRDKLSRNERGGLAINEDFKKKEKCIKVLSLVQVKADLEVSRTTGFSTM